MQRHFAYRCLTSLAITVSCLGICRSATGQELREFQSLRAAIEDLRQTFGERYPHGDAYLTHLDSLQRLSGGRSDKISQQFAQLRSRALLDNPLLDFDQLLVVKRKVGSKNVKDAGIPSNGSSNSELTRKRFDNQIATLSPVRPNGRLTTLRSPSKGGYIGEIDLHWDGKRLLFSESNLQQFAVWEMNVDGSALHRMTPTPKDVDCYDACYLPDGGIVFSCTAAYQSVPCFHGTMPACHLYRIEADGSGMRQLCFDQDLNLHPTVLNNGQVLFNRWDYTGINHVFMRQLMVMNPDGTGQRAIHGSNSWYPNALYYSRALPGNGTRLASILTGYHEPRMGQFVLVDPAEGWHEELGIIRRISGQGDPVRPAIADPLTKNDWPKFMHPFPLSGKYFLVACWPKGGECGIYLADAFDNLVLLHEEPGYALMEPTPLIRRERPPMIPSRVDLKRNDAVVYLHDVYSGPGLADVPRGTVKDLRVLEYHFGYRNLAGPDKIGYGGPWEAMRILGTVPVEQDGSAIFRAPARTPIAVQPLDAEGKAVQLMRSWFAAQPGEVVSCVGCHEAPSESGAVKYAAAALRQPRGIDEWYGPARGFDFAREVQPVLDRYCVGCHNGQDGLAIDLRSENMVEATKSWPVGYHARVHPEMKPHWPGARFTPAYDVLLPYVRRVGIEDDVSLLTPGEYHADTSPLVQMLRSGHHGVRLDTESWQRIATWIDLNAPCHGTWSDVFSPIPGKAHERRMELRRMYGGSEVDPEFIPETRPMSVEPLPASTVSEAPIPEIVGWPFDAQTARERQQATGQTEAAVDLGSGVMLSLVRIPSGSFAMGDAAGADDERPVTHAEVDQSFWMGVCEVTHEQYRCFDPQHESGYYIKRYPKGDNGKGAPLDGPRQPVVRVSWERAIDFCRWLSGRTGRDFTLPTESQWEWACRSGSSLPMSYGGPDADFSEWANMADGSFAQRIGSQKTGGLTHFVIEGARLADNRFDDGKMVTAPVGTYRPNAWGLFDMHGNVAEWTLSTYGPYARRGNDASSTSSGRKVVRGGSFFDPPRRCRSAYRVAYPSWRRVFNVGFRVVCLAESLPAVDPASAIVSRPRKSKAGVVQAPNPVPSTPGIRGTKSVSIGNTQWTTVTGKQESVGGGLKLGAGGVVVSGQPSWKDYALEARVKATDAIPCLIGRYVDANNYYNLEFTDRGMDLWKRANGNWSKIGSAAIDIDAQAPHLMKLEMQGASIQGYLDGQRKISVADPTHTQGRIGLRTVSRRGDATFSEVRVLLP